MGLFKVTMTKIFIFSENIIEGNIDDVNFWAEKEAIAHGIKLQNIIIEKAQIPNTRAGRESVKIIREELI